MARARAIETRLEQLVPSMEEYFVAGCFTREELKEVVKQRTHHEYRLVAKPLLLLDVRNAIKYELALEQKVSEHVAATKVTLRHRWVIVDRVEKIYQIGLRRLKNTEENDAIRGEYVAFLTSQGRHASLSKHFARMIQRYPMKPMLWIEGAMWEVQSGNIDNARNIIQQAQRTLTKSEDIYITALSVELEFAKKCIEELLKKDEKQKKDINKQEEEQENICEGLREENQATYQIVVELALANIVLETTAEAGAFTLEFVKRAFQLLEKYTFAGTVATALMKKTTEVAQDLVEEAAEKSKKGKTTDHLLVSRINGFLTAIVTAFPRLVSCEVMTPEQYLNHTNINFMAWFIDAVFDVFRQVAALHSEHGAALPMEVQTAIQSALIKLLQMKKAPMASISVAEGSLAGEEGKESIEILDAAVVSDILRALIVEDPKAGYEHACKALKHKENIRLPAETTPCPAYFDMDLLSEAVPELIEAATLVSTGGSRNERAPWNLEDVLPLLTPAHQTEVLAATSSVVKRKVSSGDSTVTKDRIENAVRLFSTADGGDNHALEELLTQIDALGAKRDASLAVKEVLAASWPLYAFRLRLAASADSDDMPADVEGSSGSSSDIDSSEEEAVPSAALAILAAAQRGMKTLGRLSHGSLSTAKLDRNAANAQRLIGLFALTVDAVCAILGILPESPSLVAVVDDAAHPYASLIHGAGRTAFVEALNALRKERGTGSLKAAIDNCEKAFAQAGAYTPLSREVQLVKIAFMEAVYIVNKPANTKPALEKIRTTYDMLLSAAPLPSIYVGKNRDVLECDDWVARIQFERNVARDMVGAKRVFERGVKKVKDPRRLQKVIHDAGMA